MSTQKDHLYLHLGVFAAIILLFFLLPPINVITPEGMRLTGLFIAFVYGLTVTSDAWPALVTLALLTRLGCIPSSTAMARTSSARSVNGSV